MEPWYNTNLTKYTVNIDVNVQNIILNYTYGYIKVAGIVV